MNCNTIVCSNLTTGTNEVVLIPNTPIKTLRNTGNYRLILATNIPEATSNFPVSIQVGANNIPVLCKAGNTMYANQLLKRVNYSIMYGNQNAGYTNGQFVVQDRVCPRSSTIPGATTTDNSTRKK